MAKAGNPSGAAGRSAPYERPRLKAGLKSVIETQPGGRPPRHRLKDPETGRGCTLTEREALILAIADGTRTLEQIHAAQPGPEGALGIEKLRGLFRRLGILGLLSDGPLPTPPAPPSGPDPEAVIAARRRRLAERPARARARLRGPVERPATGARAGLAGARSEAEGALGPEGAEAESATLQVDLPQADSTPETVPETPSEVAAALKSEPDAPSESVAASEAPTEEHAAPPEEIAGEPASSEAEAPWLPEEEPEVAEPNAAISDPPLDVASVDTEPGAAPDMAADTVSDIVAEGAAPPEAQEEDASSEPSVGPEMDVSEDMAPSDPDPSLEPVPSAEAAEDAAPATHAEPEPVDGPQEAQPPLLRDAPEDASQDVPEAAAAPEEVEQPHVDVEPESDAEPAPEAEAPAASEAVRQADPVIAARAERLRSRPAILRERRRRARAPAEEGTAVPALAPEMAATPADLDAFDLVTARVPAAAPEPAAADDLDDLAAGFALDDDEDDEGGGALGGRFGGGMGAGMMGGGMGGAMGGGGRERIMAMMAARQGGGMGAGMMGGMGGGMMGGGMAAAAPPPDDGPAQLSLGNPTALLRLVYIAFYPLKYLVWAIVPLVLIAGMTIVQNWTALGADLARLTSDFSRIALMILGAGIVNLASRLAQGTAILAHGGRVRSLGLKLVLGVIPRFYVDLGGVRGLDRRGQLWTYGSAILIRLAFFAGGIVLWAVARDGGTWLSQLGLIVAQFGLFMFLISALPFVPAEGQRWIGAYIGEPRLMPKMAASLRHVFLGHPLPPMMERSDLAPMLFLGIGTVLTMVAGILALGAYAAIALEAEMGGTGVVLFLGMVAAFVAWLVSMRAMIGRRMEAARAFGPAAMMGGAEAGPRAHPMEAVADPEPVASSGTARIVWAVIGAGLLAVAFLPYDYHAGGQVEILPAARGQAVARTDGEILEVLVREGARVERGQVVARLSDWDQRREIAVTGAQLAAARARLSGLEVGAKVEEIEVARSRLEAARAALAFSETELERSRELNRLGTISGKALEQAEASYQNDLADLDVAEANLDLVQSPATEEDLAVARAEVERLELELAFREDELTRTSIEAPMSGRVVTADLALRLGSFLRVGETLLEIENAERAVAAIAVPEFDITLVEPGDGVEMKVRGYPDRPIDGVVAAVAPAAEDAGYGRTVRVEAVFDNESDFLRSGMSGYAKVDGIEMRVWEAYLRSFQRFFQIEFWSWIP
ncbi:MAG: efflux RND transporter periplasmic adaptor subunit [Pseudomonadota bacterium]